MTTWEIAETGYDAWRTAEPRDLWPDFDAFADFAVANPELGWDAESFDDYERWSDKRWQAAGEAAAERTEDADREEL